MFSSPFRGIPPTGKSYEVIAVDWIRGLVIFLVELMLRDWIKYLRLLSC